MALDEQRHDDGTRTIRATGRDVKALRGLLREVSERDRDRRIAGEHPAHHPAPTGSLTFTPPRRFVRIDERGRVVYSEPWTEGNWEQVEGGYVLVSQTR